MIRRRVMLVSAAVLISASGCGPQTCKTSCDCTETTAPLKCPGEWTCGAAGTCEYACRAPCEQQPYTCAEGQSCNGSICSSRTCAAK